MCSVSCVWCCVVLCGVGGDHYNTVCRGWQEPPTGPRTQSRLDPATRNRQLLHIQQQHISRCYQGTGILPLALVMGSDTPVPVMLYKFGWTRKWIYFVSLMDIGHSGYCCTDGCYTALLSCSPSICHFVVMLSGLVFCFSFWLCPWNWHENFCLALAAAALGETQDNSSVTTASFDPE